jgi:hypothetical protein
MRYIAGFALGYAHLGKAAKCQAKKQHTFADLEEGDEH